MNFYEPSNKMYTYAKPIGILPKIFWAVTIGTVGYAIADRYVVGQEEKTKWRRAVMARVSAVDSVRDNIFSGRLIDRASSSRLCSLVQHRMRRWGKRGRIVGA
ncbi:hypothetical protein FFLO_06411 [Filobasidium floriforme]|uniref:Uncharacterized protein n=1 Tax=Filobasidium floriforme TaxID=5210 RepID=A0A8K0JGA9_9TREE|nr:uncharacterized protein HD553DRAFT_345898 [Filobasidium floriforme]KAG7528097.1 hypothetical protein FFLO_06411 [Filobasidium floriforme]KAH8079032.1 hypothetical protein HD553DRAFT_345898 [Filobasidium floriforme]